MAALGNLRKQSHSAVFCVPLTASATFFVLPAQCTFDTARVSRNSEPQNGTRAMVEIVNSAREHGYERLEETIGKALELGCSDVEAVRYLLLSHSLNRKIPESIDASAFAQYDRPMPVLTNYDALLSGTEAVA